MPSTRALRALLARRDALAGDLQRERNRAEKIAASEVPEAVSRSLQAALSFLEQQLQALQQEISQHIDQDPDLHDKRDLLLTIPGVGERVAQHLTALLSAHRFHNAAELAAYLGLVPVEWQSGSSIKGRPHLSKAGPAHLRRLLYLSFAQVPAQQAGSTRRIVQTTARASRLRASGLTGTYPAKAVRELYNPASPTGRRSVQVIDN